MGFQEVVSWYQKKIGTYDKQQWEKTIEQRILNGLTHIPMKSAKLKTEFIDLDLVRGSSFPKAKPKHGLTTVLRLATLRLLFLPLYSRWWIQQTCHKIFALLFLLYVLQLINIGTYTYNTNRIQPNSTEYVPSSEILIPMLLMLVLSIIHTQIVSTNSGPERQLQRKRSRRKPRRRKTRTRNVVSDSQKSSTENSFDSNKHDIFTSTLKTRKRTVAWGKTLSVFPERNDSHVKFADREPINEVHDQEENPRMDDDGFESLNGNGSSENGDENLQKRGQSVEPVVEENKEGLYGNEEVVDDAVCRQQSKVKSGTSFRTAWVKEVFLNRTRSVITNRRLSLPSYMCSSGEYESDTDSDNYGTQANHTSLLNERLSNKKADTAAESSCESEGDECNSTRGNGSRPPTEVTTSATEWMGVTTNSEECSYSSEYDESDSQHECNNNEGIQLDYDFTPTVILNPSCAPSDRVSCTIWERREIKKADLSVLDISSAIIARVEAMPESMDYFYSGVAFSLVLSILPALCRLSDKITESSVVNDTQLTVAEISILMVEKLSAPTIALLDAALGTKLWERSIMLIAMLQRFVLATFFFFLLAIAERTFKQRFLYAKLFSHLTSSRRAKKSDLPHFRLNKVRNIKTWLSVRSYLKRRGPQRSVDVIVSAAFITTFLLLSVISFALLKDTVALHSQCNLEAFIWSLGLGIFLLRFMTLGTKINRKYRNLSVLITEQINLYLQIEQKPHKKEELMVANSVLKLAADLLKELESPFKISGLSANPYLYTITKVVILSALSGVLSEILGFKLKLHNIKINK